MYTAKWKLVTESVYIINCLIPPTTTTIIIIAFNFFELLLKIPLPFGLHHFNYISFCTNVCPPQSRINKIQFNHKIQLYIYFL